MRTFVLALGIAACTPRGPAAPEAATDARDCFYVSAVTGFADAGANTVRLRVPGTSGYDVALAGPMCDEVSWMYEITVESGTGSATICVGDDVGLGEVHFRDGPGGRVVTCRIDEVRAPGA